MRQTAVLVVGASRGIGAGLVRYYLAGGATVHATVRDIARPGELAALHGDLTLHELDVRHEAQTAALTRALEGAGLDVIVHNAGIYRGFPRRQIMEVNAVAPIRIIDALLGAGALRRDGVVAIMTSQLGSRKGRTAVSVPTEIPGRRSTTSFAVGPGTGGHRGRSRSWCTRAGSGPTLAAPTPPSVSRRASPASFGSSQGSHLPGTTASGPGTVANTPGSGTRIARRVAVGSVRSLE